MARLDAKDIESIGALSGLQKSMLFRCRAEPGAGHYIEQLALELTDFDALAMQAALNALICAHPALRTCFLFREQSEPKSIVQRSVSCKIETLQCTTLSDQEKQRLLTLDRKRGIDLDRPPLMRFGLAAPELQPLDDSLATDKAEEKSSYCIWTFHHAVVDGWSIVLLQQQLLELYAQLRNKAPGLPSGVELTAKSYSIPSQTCKAKPGHEGWERALSTVDAAYALECLPVDLRSEVEYAELSLDSDSELMQKLQKSCREQRVTFASLAQCAWGTLLAHLNGRDSVCFGTIDSGRDHYDHSEQLIGLYMQLQPVCVTLEDSCSVREHLVSFQNRQWDLGEQLPPAPAMQAQLLKREAGAELFDTLLLVQNYPKLENPSSCGLREISGYEQADAPLVVSIAAADKLHILSRYQAHKIDKASVINLQRAFFAMLTSFADTPASLTMKDLLQNFSAKTGQIISSKSGGLLGSPRAATCIELFQKQVELNGDRIALFTVEEKLSFRDLSRRAELIRKILLEENIGAGDVVGICGSRSFDTVASMLAVLAQDAIFLPLDSTHSQQYLDNIAQRSNAKLILLTCKRSPVVHSAKSINLAELAGSNVGQELQVSRDSNGTQDTMCLMFTSGSTGDPKPVMLSHQGVVNRIQWLEATYPAESEDKYCLRTPLSFVDTIAETFTPLCNGSSCRVIADEELSSLNRLLEVLVEAEVSRLTIVPSLLAPLLDTAETVKQPLDSLRFCLSSGEPLSMELAQRVRSQLPKCRILNLYGSTEVSADALWCDVDSLANSAHSTVPIGQPISGMVAQVQNKCGRTLPAGFVGELCLAGVGVAPAYREESNSLESAKDGHGGVYRTGDLAYIGQQNMLHYLGRVDRQVKLRGQRINLSAVENCVGSHPELTRCAVILHNGSLVCFYAAALEIDSDLSAHAANQLPRFAVPERFIWRNELPTLPNGKVNYAVLAGLISETDVVVGSGADLQLNLHQRELMATVANVWESLLPGENIGADSDFFAAGGHSLLAMQMIAQLERVLGFEIALPLLMQNARLDEFTYALFSSIPKQKAPELIELQIGKTGEGAPAALICLQGDAYNIVPHVADSRSIYWISQWSICVDLIRDPVPVAIESVEQTAQRYAEHIESLCNSRPFVMLAACGAAVIAIEAARVLEKKGIACEKLFLMDLPRGELTTASQRGFGERQGKNLLHSAYGYFMRMSGGNHLLARITRARINRKIRKRIALTDIEAAGLMHLRLSDALGQYTPTTVDMPIEMILSRTWYRGVSDPGEANVPVYWRPFLRNVQRIHFSPAENHGELLAPESARFIAGIIANNE